MMKKLTIVIAAWMGIAATSSAHAAAYECKGMCFDMFGNRVEMSSEGPTSDLAAAALAFNCGFLYGGTIEGGTYCTSEPILD